MRKLLTLFSLWTLLLAQAYPQVQMDRINVKGINGTLYADQLKGDNNNDIGDKVNKAQALLPYVGSGTGRIVVGPPATNTCYSFSTPIVLNTNNKPVVVDFGGSCLIYTGTGTAITLDTGSSNTIVSSGVYNGHLIGPGTGIGIQLGLSSGNGCQQCASNMEVDGFPTLMVVGGLNVHLWAPKLNGTGLAGSVCLSLQGSDDVRVFGGNLNSCAKLVSFDTASTGPVQFVDTTFIEAKGGATPTYISATAAGGVLQFTNCHFTILTAASSQFLTQTASRTIFTNNVFEDDRTTGSLTSYMTVTGASANIDIIGGDVSSLGETATEFVLFSTNATGNLIGVTDYNPSLIPLLWNTSYTAAPVTELGTVGISSTPTDIFLNRILSPLALTFSGSRANPSDATATAYNQSGVGPTISGNAFQVRCNSSGQTDCFDVSSGGVQAKLPLVIGATGSAIAADYKGSGTLTYGAIGANACAEQPLTITGAASGDPCFASPASDPGANFSYGGCRVSGASTAQVRICSGAGGTPSAVSWQGWARH